ncbi:MAG: helix-turn-helix transcriptional regulator [Clostridia bacterium]|nr:helix-turn-helix transcriptional regulator [Clostridia bacterium]
MAKEQDIIQNYKEQYSESFTRNLKKLMLIEGYTQESLAVAAGLSVDTIKNCTRTKLSLPKYETLAALANVFGVSTDYLCGNELNTPDNLRISYFKVIIEMIKKTGMQVDISDNKIVFHTDNQAIVNSFKYAIEDEYDFDKVLFMTLGDKLLSTVEYEELRKQFYIYGHNIEIDEDVYNTVDDYIKELEEAIKYTNIETDEDCQQKIIEWKNTNGNPKLHISDVYYDLFYKNKG